VSVVNTGLLPGGDADQFAYPNLTATDLAGNVVPVVTGAGDYGYLGRVTLNFDAGGNFVGVDASSNPQANVGITPDAATQANIVDPVEAFVAALDALVIARTSVALVGNGDRDVIRAEEAPLGNLVADAYLDAATDNAAASGVPAPDLAFVNGGGIRDDIAVGDISVGTTFDISPFGNIVSIVEDVTAADLALIFENAYSRTEDALDGPGINLDRRPVGGTGRFLQVSEGVEVVYDITAQPLELDRDGNVVAAGERIVGLVINGVTVIQDGVLVDPTLTFDVATADFLAGGGDQIFGEYLSQDYAFTRIEAAGGGLVTDQNALQGYIEELAMGDATFDVATISAYAMPVGRIVAIPEPATAGLAAAAGLLLARRRR